MAYRPLSPNCIRFHQNPRVHPITGSQLVPGSQAYNDLVRECGPPPLTPYPPVTQVPLQPTIQLPRVTTTAQPTIQLPRATTAQPTIQLPQPTIQLPRVTTAQPTIQLPTIQLPKPTIQLPQAQIRQVRGGDFPAVITTVRAPTITPQIQPEVAQTIGRTPLPPRFTPPAPQPQTRPPTIIAPIVTTQPTTRPPNIVIPPANAQPVIGPAGIVQPTIRPPTITIPAITIPAGIAQQTFQIPRIQSPTRTQLPPIGFPTVGLPAVGLPTVGLPGMRLPIGVDPTQIVGLPGLGLLPLGLGDLPILPIIQVPEPERGVFPQEPVADNYYDQPDPRPEEFMIQAEPENAHFIQASIETARNLFPSFELYIQAAQNANILPEYTRRGLYPSYMRDASSYEIFKIYRGNTAALARDFLTAINQDRHEHTDNRQRYNQIYPISQFMQDRGYIYQYVEYVRGDRVPGQATQRNLPLTPENFVASITPDQAILMEAWRLRALHGGVGQTDNTDLLGLRDIVQQYIDQGFDRRPVLQTIGFDTERLKRAIRDVEVRIVAQQPPQLRRHRRIPQEVMVPITRDYIRYEGEQAVNEGGRNINNKGLATNSRMPKPYYMMLYNELRLRGLLDGTRF